MAGIDISHPHALPPERARAALDDVAAKLAQRFDMRTAWDGDRLTFSRSGVDGAIDMQPGLLHVTAKLGFLLAAMRGPIEAEIRRVLDEKFS